MTLRTIPCAAALLCVACRTSDVPASTFSNDPDAVPIPLIRFNPDSIAFAQYSGVAQAQNFVIKDAAAWNDLWQRIYATQTPVPPLPDVDFNTQMVVASAIGGKPSGGYGVLLTGAARDTGGLVIAVRATSPGAHCIVTQAFTQPIDIARLVKTGGDVRFEQTQQTVDCGS
jgi:hypothetical protein